jgi:arylsulfatase
LQKEFELSNQPGQRHLSRREFHRVSAGALAAPLFGAAPARAEPQEWKGPPASDDKRGLNVVFIFTDQERYTAKWPPGLSLPAHERLQRTGTTFTQHYTSAIMCTPSRSVLMTGLQTPDNKMFDNCDCPWQNSLSPKVPTIGHMLRKAGYYTAYKGKWHLNKEFDSHQPKRSSTNWPWRGCSTGVWE